MPHHAEHPDAASAVKTAEQLAARMCVLSWQQALGAFAATPHQSAA
ncbi:hypothetical protein [Streptomyces chartreusis]